MSNNLVWKTLQKTVTAAGTAEALSAAPLQVRSFMIKALGANTGLIYAGDSTVSSSDGYELTSGDSIGSEGPPFAGGTKDYDLNDIYIDSAVNGEGVCVVYQITE